MFEWSRGGKVLQENFKANHKVGYNIFLYDDQSPRYFSSLKFAEILGIKIKSMGRVASNYHDSSSDDCRSCRPINADLGIWHQNVLVLRENQYPSVVIEVGNLMDTEDEKLISSNQIKKIFALTLNEAVRDYFVGLNH